MKRLYTETIGNQRGSALVVTMLVLFAIVVVGASLSMMSSTDIKIAGNQRFSTDALYVAEAGLNEAIHRLTLPNPTMVTVGGSQVDAAIRDDAPYDPNWRAHIYLRQPAASPWMAGSVVNTGTIQDPNGNYLQYSEASGNNDILTIMHKWEDLNGDNIRDPDEIVLYDKTMIPPENFTSGFPVEVVTVTGQAGLGRRIIQAEVSRQAIKVRTLGALFVDKAIDITGSVSFCGHNHDMNMPPFTQTPACNAWHMADGALPGVTSTGDDVDVQGVGADLDGFPSAIDTSSANPFYSLNEVLGLTVTETNDLLAQANQTSVTNPFEGITYVQGDAEIQANYTGHGLLYVTGDLKAAGGWVFKGLIFVEGDLFITGTPWILGTVIVRGTSDYNFSAGNAGIMYSADALTNYLSDATPMNILSWREL
jgi:hypothetical protein